MKIKKSKKYAQLINQMKGAYFSKINRKVNILDYCYKKLLEISDGDINGVIYMVNFVLVKFLKNYDKRKEQVNSNQRNGKNNGI